MTNLAHNFLRFLPRGGHRGIWGRSHGLLCGHGSADSSVSTSVRLGHHVVDLHTGDVAGSDVLWERSDHLGVDQSGGCYLHARLAAHCGGPELRTQGLHSDASGGDCDRWSGQWSTKWRPCVHWCGHFHCAHEFGGQSGHCHDGGRDGQFFVWSTGDYCGFWLRVYSNEISKFHFGQSSSLL